MAITSATKVIDGEGGYYENKEEQVVIPDGAAIGAAIGQMGDLGGSVPPATTTQPPAGPTNDEIIAGTGLFPGMIPTAGATPPPTESTTTKTGGMYDLIKDAWGNFKDKLGNVITDVKSYIRDHPVVETGGAAAGDQGINGALGNPDFTWQKDAANKAKTMLDKDIETTRKEFLQGRSQIDQAAQQGQDQYSMSKYSTNQSIEKAGWAGGYVLDAQRQTEYLKASIQAQMYGQMELQAMGYDSQLAAARLAYDLGKQDLARQYYQDAVANQVQKAQLTGVWVSPEVNDMLTQSQAASAILAKKEGLSDEEKLLDKEYQQAKHLKDQVTNWFAETGLSEVGVDTLAKMTFDLDVQAFNEAKIQAALESMEPGQYVMKNADGSYVMNEATGRPQVIDLNVASPQEQWDFFNTDYGHIALRNQVNNLAAQTMQNFVNNTAGLADMSDAQVAAAFSAYLAKGSNDLVKDYVNDFGSNDIMQRLINTHPEAFVDGQYSYSFKSGDETYTYKYGTAIAPGSGGTTGSTFVPTPVTTNYIETQPNASAVMNILMTPENTQLNELYNTMNELDLEAMFTTPGVASHWLGTTTGLEFWTNMLGVGSVRAGETIEVTQAMIDNAIDMVGEENLELLTAKSLEYENMSETQKRRLTTDQIADYERIQKFTMNYLGLLEVLKQAELHDTSVLDGFEYVGDSWRQTGQAWGNVKGVGSFFLALGQSGFSILDTVAGGIAGIIGSIFK
jgi:hypothetical protein